MSSIYILFSVRISFAFLFYDVSDGKVRATRRAISVTIVIMRLGNGLSNSAVSGLNIVKNLAQKLHIPIAVLRLADPKIRGSV